MKHRQSLRVFGSAIALGSLGWAQVTSRVSIGSGGTQGNGDSKYPSISADGTSVAFYSLASNLVPGDTNGAADILSRDWLIGSIESVSVDSNEAPSNAASDTLPPAVSADGNFVAFASLGTNLVPGDTNGTWDVFVRNRATGTTQRVSVSSAGVQGNAQSFYASISADGRYVAFGSDATNLVTGDTNGVMDVFVRDLLSGVTQRVSLDGNSMEGNGRSIEPSISADGRYVAFSSFATNLRFGDTNGFVDIFLRDRQTSFTTWISQNAVGQQPNGHCGAPSISADGLHVAFLSGATNMVSGDSNGAWDVFLRHWTGNQTLIVSVNSSGTLSNGESTSATISPDGLSVAFASIATNLVPGDTNGFQDVFVRRLSGNTTERVSVASNGAQANGGSERPSISADGRYVAFASDATNLVPADTNSSRDAFVHDGDATSFTSLCDAGVGGVHVCPCSNPPNAPGRGCNNSSGTGGAFLTASGFAYLSNDSLVFTTFGEKPVALSIVLQGNALDSSGLVYGQGVRCVAGTLKRLYSQVASSGSITAPNLGAGDPTVSARSAAKGDPISPGQSRWYLVYYRDPNVLGGCPAGSTFNATQTGQVSWGP